MPSRKLQNHSPSGSAIAAESPAINSQETYMPPSLARFYMTHLTVTLLHYQGFTSCQAEVISELEKQVEDHSLVYSALVLCLDIDVANIFGTAKLLAEQCGRREPQSGDVVSALEVVRSESLPVPYPYDDDSAGSSMKPGTGSLRSRRDRRRDRGARLLTEDLVRFIQRDNRLRAQPPDGIPLAGLHSLPLIIDESPESEAEPPMLTISDSEDVPGQSSVAGPSNFKVGKKKRKLGYMLDVAPSLPDLPPRHTWKRSVSEPTGGSTIIPTPASENASSRLSTSALAYLASTLSTSSSIPPELTIVNHRLSGNPTPAPDPYSDAVDASAKEGVPGPLVQLDYTSVAMQSKLDLRLNARPVGSRKKSGIGGTDGDEPRPRKLKFIVPGLHKRQPNAKISAL
ncbi:hypothetical protein NCC49_004401 [Naganishia albida]|nr:hypothetical protein NCC49_004401 [Naganishia albida]